MTVQQQAKTCRPAPILHAIRRQRLLDALHRALALRLTVLSAPAGYGKTTLLRQFVDELPSAPAWVTLDASDRDPLVLVADVRAALRLAEDAIRYDGSHDWREAAHRLCTQVDRIGDAIVIVLDDYQEVDGEPEIDSLLGFLLENLPEQVRVILSSRTSAQLSILPSLVTQRRASRLGKQAMRLTPDEVRFLIQQVQGRHLSSEDASELCEACEGWVAGLMLMTAEGGVPEGVRGKLEVAEYFRKVIVGRLSQEIRGFLLATSVLSEMSSTLCDRLLRRADSEAILEDLHRRNLFVERLESEPPIFRYHRLFRDFLCSELQRDNPLALPDLHRRAGRIYLSQRDAVSAARHFIGGRSYERAASALATVSGKQLVEAPGAVADLLDSIPEKALSRHPRALLTRARLYYRANEMDKAVDIAAKAFRLAEAIPDPVGMAEAEVLRATALKHRGEITLAMRACRNALRLSEGPGAPHVRAESLLQMGICRGLQGRFLEATRALKRARGTWAQLGDLEREGITLEALGTASWHLGQPDQTHVYYERAREAWARLGYESALIRLLTNLASLYLLQGEYDAACDFIESVFAKLRTSPDARLEAITLVNLAELKRDVQLYDEALHYYLVGQERARECLETRLSVYAAEGRASVLRLRNQLDSAERLLRHVLPQAREVGELVHGRVLISLAAVNVQHGRHKVAEEQLDQAIKVLRVGTVSVELARAHFWRARIAYKAGQLAKVRQALLQVAVSLRRAYVLPLADIRGGQRLLEHAVASDIEPEFFASLLRKVRTRFSHLAGRGGVPADRHPGPATTSDLTIKAFGEATVRVDGKRIPNSAWRSEKSKELFFFLAWQSKGMRRLEIEAALWPDFAGGRAHTNFRVSLFRARQATFPDAILFSGSQYHLNNRVRVRFDAKDFVDLANSGRKHKPGSPERLLLLQRACELYTGPFLDGTYSDWCITVRNNLETQYLSASIEVADFLEREGNFSQAMIWYEKAIRIDALLEGAYEGLIRASVAAGDLAAARQHYRLYHSITHTELNCEPPEYLRQLIAD